MTNKTHRTYRAYISFIFFVLFFILAPTAVLSACVASCPSGQTSGSCPLDPSCDPNVQSCSQGVECAPSTTTSTTQRQVTNVPTLPPINLFCFSSEECLAAPYNGVAHTASECMAQDKLWKDGGYVYNCYAKNPKTHLNVSIGGYEVIGIENYIKRLYIYLISIAGITAGIMIVWAGVKWLTSAGSPDRISDAKKKIGNSLIGLVLIMGSYVILQTVNPALVELRLPSVKLMRQMKAAEEKCPNEGPYRAQFPCGREAVVQGVGHCVGQHCASGGGCYSYQITPRGGSPTTEYVCLNTAQCPGTCNEIDITGGLSNEIGYGLCLSDACKVKISTLCRTTSFGCRIRSSEGGGCENDRECQPGFVCNLGEAPNVCRRPGLAPGISCDNDRDCGQGMVCNKEEGNNQCVASGSLPACAECDRNEVCASGICGSDDECAGMPGEEDSIDDDGDGEFCD